MLSHILHLFKICPEIVKKKIKKISLIRIWIGIAWNSSHFSWLK